ncbi:hypothetical protein [Burkholderia pseudomallei]|uniref:hypothetical protein n=1 Tax=Burkholderia pseudomallei TaxID=28450 RepID=UPI0028BD92D5|nr:hypothetical protein [Burkholderia pseudomallei]
MGGSHRGISSLLSCAWPADSAGARPMSRGPSPGPRRTRAIARCTFYRRPLIISQISTYYSRHNLY